MPRLARLDAPGVVHHVMIRGIEKKNIFRDNKDQDNLLERISELIPKNRYCLLWKKVVKKGGRRRGAFFLMVGS